MTSTLLDHPILQELFGTQTADIRFVFHCLELAEQVCTELGDPPGLFRLLRPSPILRGKADRLLLAHMHEVARRLAAGEDTRPGTDAECLAAMMGAATCAPLHQTGLALVERLFEAVMGETLGEPLGRERFLGAADEELARLRKKLAVPDRA